MVTRHVRLASTCATLALLAGLLTTHTETAWAAGCGTRSNYFDGYNTGRQTPARPVEGVRAKISNPGGYSLCSGDSSPGTNFVTSWTMVVDHDPSSGHYAQSGYMYRAGYNGCVKSWAEQAIASGFADYYYGGCVPLGQTHTFWEQMVTTSSGYRIRSNVDNHIIRQSTVDPFQYWATPFGVQFEEEATYRESTIAGRPTSKQVISGAEIQKYTDDQFTTIAGSAAVSPGSSSSSWHYEMPVGNQYRLWRDE